MRLMDTRRLGLQQYTLIQEQLKDPNLTFDQRLALITQANAVIKDLASLQKAVIKKARKQREINPPKKRGRPRKQFDSDGNPLYNDSPKMEEPNSKEAFLSRLQSDEIRESESD